MIGIVFTNCGNYSFKRILQRLLKTFLKVFTDGEKFN